MRYLLKSLRMLILVLFSCQSTTDTTDNDFVILVDITDPLTVKPRIDHLPECEIWQSMRVEVAIISDKDINQIKVFNLPSENSLTGVTSTRKAKLSRFKSEINSYLASVSGAESQNLHHSIIYRQLAKSLNDISKRKSANKQVFVYSNLIENEEVSFLDPKTMSLASNNPRHLDSIFENTAQLSNLAGVSVQIIYSPKSFEDNTRYRVISNYFKHLFENKQANVTIGLTH